MELRSCRVRGICIDGLLSVGWPWLEASTRPGSDSARLRVSIRRSLPVPCFALAPDLELRWQRLRIGRLSRGLSHHGFQTQRFLALQGMGGGFDSFCMRPGQATRRFGHGGGCRRGWAAQYHPYPVSQARALWTHLSCVAFRPAIMKTGVMRKVGGCRTLMCCCEYSGVSCDPTPLKQGLLLRAG